MGKSLPQFHRLSVLLLCTLTVCKSIREKMWPPRSPAEQSLSASLMCCPGRVREPPEWRSAGCCFHSITPCRLCCSRSSWKQQLMKSTSSTSPLEGTSDLPLTNSDALHPRLKHLSLITGTPRRPRYQQAELGASRLPKVCLVLSKMPPSSEHKRTEMAKETQTQRGGLFVSQTTPRHLRRKYEWFSPS